MKIRRYLSSYLGESSETATDRLFNKILGVIHVMVRPINEFLSEAVSTVSERAVMRPNRAHEGLLTSVVLGRPSVLVLGSIGLTVLLYLNGPLKRSCAYPLFEPGYDSFYRAKGIPPFQSQRHKP